MIHLGFRYNEGRNHDWRLATLGDLDAFSAFMANIIEDSRFSLMPAVIPLLIYP